MKNNNFLDYIPKYTKDVKLVPVKDGLNKLDVYHTKIADKIAQKVFGKTNVTHITLDKFGSFVCSKIDGKNSIYDIGQLVKAEFGDKAEPLYERLVVYIRTMRNNDFIKFIKKNS